MRFPEPVRMADGGAAPVWERSSKRGGFSLIGLLVTVFALIGVLVVVLRVTDHSFAAGGARIDGWVDAPVAKVKGLFGKKDAAPAAEAAPTAAAAPAAPTATDPAATAPAPAAPAAAPAAAAAAPAPAKK